MRKRNIHIRRWSVDFIFSFDTHNEGIVIDSLIWADAPASVESKVSELISAGYLDVGFTFSEEFAYLVGDITQEVSDIVCKMSCPNCRQE